jgi:hypothetical protein
MAAWTNEQRKRFAATMRDKKARKQLLALAPQGVRSPEALRTITAEVKVGSEIAFAFGDMRLVIRAVEADHAQD